MLLCMLRFFACSDTHNAPCNNFACKNLAVSTMRLCHQFHTFKAKFITSMDVSSSLTQILLFQQTSAAKRRGHLQHRSSTLFLLENDTSKRGTSTTNPNMCVASITLYCAVGVSIFCSAKKLLLVILKIIYQSRFAK